MRKITKVLLGIFFVGVLLSGIGVGLAFVEYSSFEYLGEEAIGGKEMQTDKVVFTAGEDIEKTVKLDFPFFYGRLEPVVYDGSLPENTIVCEITYNSELWSLVDGSRTGGMTEYYYVDAIWTGNDFSLIMEKKDEILKDLKDRKFRSYDWNDEITVRIKAHPNLEGRLRIDD